ncbi:MAG: tRNA epoxyqueuosine(34) reductase QueG [Phycisphaerales bacterium]|nr:tRNA epoxyqueuosine(34) reductase QueG [Phycisphaerales bacterium]
MIDYDKVMTPTRRTELVEQAASMAGFEAAGVAAARPIGRIDYVAEWLARGYAGEMDYLVRHHELRSNPANLLPGAKSVIVVAQSYRPSQSDENYFRCDADSVRGRIARYAWGRDYHRVLRKKLRDLLQSIRQVIREPFDARICVDTAPLIERELAAAAGIGWIGKNTMLLHPRLGSYLFLGEIITTLDLAPNQPMADHCGTCTRCLQACPTQALHAPYAMDAHRCIAYLTIEHRGEVSAELAARMGDWVFGCDRCQEVCPFNHKAPPSREAAYRLPQEQAWLPRPPLNDMLNWTEDEYCRHLAGKAIRRAKLTMLQRNAVIALANHKSNIDGRQVS